MLPVSDAVKNLFKDGQSHNYSLKIYYDTIPYFTNNPNACITDDDIKAESATLSETLFAGETVKFGVVSASCFTVTLINVETALKGKYINVILSYDNNDIPYGRFYVESYEKKAYSTERTLTAYDYTYFLGVSGKDKFMEMYVEYIQHGTYDMSTAISVCHSTFEYLGLHYTPFTSATTYAFNMFLPDQMTMATMCEWMGELYHGWWRSDRYGVLHFLQIDTSATAEEITTMRPRTCEYSSATTGGAFTGIEFNFYTDKYKTVLYGTDKNAYKMTPANPFLINHLADIETIGAALLTAFNAIEYVPNKINFDGRPYLECGDMYTFTTDDDTETPQTITAPLIQQTIKGIGALTTTIRASGSSYADNVNSTNIVSQSEQLAITQASVDALIEKSVDYYKYGIVFVDPTWIYPTPTDSPPGIGISDGEEVDIIDFQFKVSFEKVPVALHSLIEVAIDTLDDDDIYTDCIVTITVNYGTVVNGERQEPTLWKEWDEAFGDGEHVINIDILRKYFLAGEHYITVTISPSGGGIR